MENYREATYNEWERDQKAIDFLVQSHRQLEQVLPKGGMFFYIKNLQSQHFEYIGKQVTEITGVPYERCLEHGMAAALEKIHPSDRSIIMGELLEDILDVLKSVPVEEQKEVITTFNYRFFHEPLNTWIHLQDRFFMVASDPMGRPALMLGYCMRVDTPFQHVHGCIRHQRGTEPEQILHEFSYYADPAFRTLTHREIEILTLLAKGLSSKLIASELGLVTSTVDTHRRKLLRKTGMENVAHLVSKAVQMGVVTVEEPGEPES
ncbi:helix-turn-helix transcriptional regulator [Pontibacter sp. G13]|uniref:response regulator transcription factor n=1 Tax=Pontibacter sp. G13 TaxID=3074898 RepID=UPI002889346F|nr:helix-turn-helix transcriptional regulator [Pontibacter sp. G13]WNJ17357.1 helix-turn-helix transcriptional regulator [Pontibacter sp. G13]